MKLAIIPARGLPNYAPGEVPEDMVEPPKKAKKQKAPAAA